MPLAITIVEFFHASAMGSIKLPGAALQQPEIVLG
jgi:hypothetical protein